MEIGIFTFWASHDNYGQVLQSFALQYFIRSKWHCKVEVIRYFARKPLSKYVLKKTLKEYIALICPFLKTDWAIEYRGTKKRNFKGFKKEYINYSSRICYGKRELSRFAEKYDILIAGSDQIWSMMLDNPNNCVYFLDFGTKKQKRISYAASFGQIEYPVVLKSKLRKELEKFNAISVRELDGVSICKACGYEAVQVLDPTFLLEEGVYRSFTKKNRSKKYCFLYILNITSEDDIYWKELQSFIHPENIVCTTASGYMKSKVLLNGVEYEDSTITQWLSNIAFADLVITTSFHGVVFSIIFHKKFIYIPLKGTHAASNNRVLDLLNRLGLSQRILKDNTVLPEIFDNQIDYVSVDEKLSLQKAASIQYLVNALNLETE